MSTFAGSVDLNKAESFGDIAYALEKHYHFVSDYNFSFAGESLGSMILNMVTYIADCIIKLLNNFKSVIFKFYKNLKRTELRYYIESNAIKVKRILSVPYTELVDINVDIPRGMSKPYKVTTNTIVEALTILDMKNRAEGFLGKILDLEQKVYSNDLSSSKYLGKVDDLSVIQKSYNEIDKCFKGGTGTVKVKFSKVFEDDNCFEDSLNLILNSETFDYEVATIHNTLEKCSEHMFKIVDYIKENRSELNKTQILDLSKSTMTIAKLFDMYGNAIYDKQKVEHNFVLVLTAVDKACL